MEFDEWVEIILEHEGGFVDNPNDLGGVTNMGVTQKTYSEFIGREASREDMEEMTKDDAVGYYNDLWGQLKLERLPSAIRGVYADVAVNAGRGGADRVLQMAINTKVNPNDVDEWIDVDGVAGSGTLRALEEANLTALDYVTEQLMYYANNCFKGSSYSFKQRQRTASKESSDDSADWLTTRTSQNGFIRGWTRRAVENLSKLA